MNIQRAYASEPAVLAQLRRHPRVESVDACDGPGIRFWVGDWEREVLVNQTSSPILGMVELLDNNPLVCADAASTLIGAEALAVLALGPLAASGLLAEEPVVQASCGADSDVIAAGLGRLGWDGDVVISVGDLGIGQAIAVSALAVVPTPSDLDDLDELFRERYSRAFFVRESSEVLDPVRVLGTPQAHYRLRITPDEPNSLLTITVLADATGKAGASNLVHMMNVMCGFEESLGIVD